ncbi:hypothetical protein DIPPA_08702 [Diplonema papillatum]|nr:hypothetical protein DIPPA_08702 [Diplonema papillatum]
MQPNARKRRSAGSPRGSLAQVDASMEALDQWAVHVRNKRSHTADSRGDSVPVEGDSFSAFGSVKSPAEARKMAQQLLAGRSRADNYASERAAKKVAETIFSAYADADDGPGKHPRASRRASQNYPAAGADPRDTGSQGDVSLSSDLVHQVHSIPVRATPSRQPQQQQPRRASALYDQRRPSAPLYRAPDSLGVPMYKGGVPPLMRFAEAPGGRHPRSPARSDDGAATWKNACVVGSALADEEFTEETARAKAYELLLEYKAYREETTQRAREMEEQLLESRMTVAELEGRVSELSKQLREERMRSDKILQQDLTGERAKSSSKAFLKSKLREVIAVHEVLQWQMHEKDREIRSLEDIIKAHLLIHPGPSRPLKHLLARRLPQFMERIEGCLPIMREAQEQVDLVNDG